LNHKILYCILNWGLGHASRSIPIISNLIEEGRQVEIASDGLPLKLLQNAFPNLPCHSLPSYDIKYTYNSIAANILSQSFKILRAIKTETKVIGKLVSDHHFTQIISDNRFGCYHPSCNNIFISHQLRLIHPNPFIQASATRLNLSLINKFDECWVPDSPDSSLSGMMSSNSRAQIPINFIGAQSRFSQIVDEEVLNFNSCAILSGPEPQRSIFEKKIAEQVSMIEGKHVIITGIQRKQEVAGNITYFGILNADEISQLIQKSKNIISRSGYSSLMDYQAMGRKAILVPTPGQTEQVYLGSLASALGRHIVLKQENLDLTKVLT